MQCQWRWSWAAIKFDPLLEPSVLQACPLMPNYVLNQTVMWNKPQPGLRVRRINIHLTLRKKSRASQPAPKKPVCNTNFTPAANQLMEIDTNDAESRQDETDIEEVGNEADAYERVHNTLCNSKWPVSFIYSLKCTQCWLPFLSRNGNIVIATKMSILKMCGHFSH